MYRIEWDDGNKQWLVIAPLGVIAIRTPHKWQAEKWIERHA